jgi:hypothetical protein
MTVAIRRTDGAGHAGVALLVIVKEILVDLDLGTVILAPLV